VIAVEPADHSNKQWPDPQLCTITAGTISITNNTTEPILLGKDIKQIHVRPTTLPAPPIQGCSKPQGAQIHTQEVPILESKSLSSELTAKISALHHQYAEVFDKNLSTGYNGAYGPHTCHLNWAGPTRPTADQVRMVSYSHELKQLHQAVCDELTNNQVLGIPQEHGVNVQFVCPSFLRRKPRAKGKPNHLLTTDDVRLVVNFSPVNDHLKNIPSVKTTPNDILIHLGRWKHIIIFDLHQGFFQNHMAPEDCKWLGIATPFGGIRFLRRSGQGLLGQSEELEELLAKILKTELHNGTCCKIADDIIIGGQTHQEALATYATILNKFSTANIKLAASKTHIFPTSADILGWKWSEGGRLNPSPHRQLALKNTKQDDIKTVKDMRSWIGLYKTLLIATPNLATIMDPFDHETADRDSREKITWTTQLTCAFTKAKNHIDNVKELYLPSPEDQLLLVPDGSQKTPGIGHVLYAVVNGHRKPVRYHSVKLPENCKKWSPCEIEALAFATGIQAEKDLIKESKHPLLIAPDSSPVKDAVNLIKKGRFSASARMNSFMTNINRFPIEVLHVSGKANLNAVGDMQSRNPSTCTSIACAICTFVQTSINSVLNPTASLGAIGAVPLYNTKSWAAAQAANIACKTAASHLRTGKQPSKKSGKIFSEIRRYCAIAKIGADGCLVAPQPKIHNTYQLDKIIIPTPLLPSVLWHMHQAENHPAKTQLKAKFDRMFFGIMAQQHIDTIYEECFQCKVQAHLPSTLTSHQKCTEVLHPGQYFHADVIRREKQKIFLLRDQFSTLSSATIIPSEQQQDLKAAIIALTNPIRLAPQITVRTDNATGFQALLKDNDLKQLGITLELTDPHNKNANAVVDKACAELEQELNKLKPQGGQINEAALAQAILLLNRKLRRQDQLTATEIHFARHQTTNSNLNLDDSKLRLQQTNARHVPNRNPPKQDNIQEGDTVVVASKPAKHTSREVYLVTQAQPDKIHMQKLANPFSPNPIIRSKTYVTKRDLLHPIHQPKHTFPYSFYKDNQPVHPQTTEKWSPIDQRYYHQAPQEEDEDQHIPAHQENNQQEDQVQPPLPHILQVENNPQQPPPTPHQQMGNWLQEQRQRTIQARTLNQNALHSFIPPPIPPPPPNQPLQHERPQPHPPAEQQIPQPRQAKLKALQTIAGYKHQNIPQLEGAEQTPETTPDITPDSSYTSQDHHHLSPQVPWSPPPHDQHHPLNIAFLEEEDHDIFNTAFLAESDEEPPSSLDWDNLQEQPDYMSYQPHASPSPEWEDHNETEGLYGIHAYYGIEEHDDLCFASPHPEEHHMFFPPPLAKKAFLLNANNYFTSLTPR